MTYSGGGKKREKVPQKADLFLLSLSTPRRVPIDVGSDKGGRILRREPQTPIKEHFAKKKKRIFLPFFSLSLKHFSSFFHLLPFPEAPAYKHSFTARQAGERKEREGGGGGGTSPAFALSPPFLPPHGVSLLPFLLLWWRQRLAALFEDGLFLPLFLRGKQAGEKEEERGKACGTDGYTKIGSRRERESEERVLKRKKEEGEEEEGF